ncbi:hypothetical protein M0804_006078 [Polistes exclamans]|nr:hypothetical protein M0804_006078 [Polistes exclamans]
MQGDQIATQLAASSNLPPKASKVISPRAANQQARQPASPPTSKPANLQARQPASQTASLAAVAPIKQSSIEFASWLERIANIECDKGQENYEMGNCVYVHVQPNQKAI